MNTKGSLTHLQLLEALGVGPAADSIRRLSGREIAIPLTTPFLRPDRASMDKAPGYGTLRRKLLNGLLYELRRAGVFQAGSWLDIGGGLAYRDWLQISPDRYRALNLQETTENTLVADIEDAATIDFSARHDGILSLNCLYMLKNITAAYSNIMRLLKPGGRVVLDFSINHHWYRGSDGAHYSTLFPCQIAELATESLEEFAIVPVGNMFQSCMDYYSRKDSLATFGRLMRWAALSLGKHDRSGDAPLSYVVVGQKRNLA